MSEKLPICKHGALARSCPICYEVREAVEFAYVSAAKLVREAYLPDAYSMPVLDEIADEILALKDKLCQHN
jgi:sarcosine oxidase delta subunit